MGSWDANLVNSFGLALDIVGAGLVWKFGLPASISREGAVGLITNKADEAEKLKAARYDFRSAIGFLLLILGFALQIVSNWIGD